MDSHINKTKTIKAAAITACLAATTLAMTACTTPQEVKPGAKIERSNQEIIVAGQRFNVGAPVVLWTDPGGYDAYRVDKRFGDIDSGKWENIKESIDTPNRYNLRYGKPSQGMWSKDELEQIRGGGWELEQLQEVVDQFVYHYDVCGTSEVCFRVLHDMRGLSVHFMLDIDGTIYQTMDLKERAWHAGTSNDRSVGIEIANIGAYSKKELSKENNALDQWYKWDENQKTYISIPERLGDGGVKTPNFVGRPSFNDKIKGNVQGRDLYQYDLTPQQYESLVKLTAALTEIFPKMKLDYPRDEHGELITTVLPENGKDFSGLVGHYHVSKRKIDPGPAFQWDRIIDDVKKIKGKK
ncbi:N-acetyl-anhydromuranmyl-L-alanine amidase [Poriferisphaera corsica]|uniref:N-acetylmuramoyl-L-alanine amidase n=1 Tax=Poriferisphaera corsica TaxID=2528020 RepID=A0A517YYE8_9BACT|nr:N-acetylmuramoyl-L-alanine amidase [Poriferisphaera corsica]QDU35246.1 N-acetyl-anhydromuranmyl-L-alanine amidase [Poriferisphaera corsica]